MTGERTEMETETESEGVKIMRKTAIAVVRKITNEAHTIQSMIKSCDVDLAHDGPAQLKKILAVKTAAVVARQKVIDRRLGNIEALRTQHASIFTPEMAESWVNFTHALDNLNALKIKSAEQIPDWVALRRKLTNLFGVDLTPANSTLSYGEDSEDPDKGFECDLTIREKLIKAGSGRNIELGQKSVMAYVDGNMVEPHDKFSGERDEDSIHELFDRLEVIHLAPVEQVSYKIKVDAVFKCLEGRARQDVIGFKGASTRREYLELWRGLFRQYGVTANDVARQLRLINGAAPKSSDLRDMMSYMNVLNNAAVSLKHLGFPEDQIASALWNSIKTCVPNHLADYCRRKVKRFDRDYGSDVATWHSINGPTSGCIFFSFLFLRIYGET
jgi:hypothetical protein